MPEEETRERILTAAAEIFAAKGYDGATTRAIAALAGVNEVTLFRHFGSKQNLFQATLEHYSAIPGVEKALGGQLSGDVRQDLTMIGTHILTMFTQRRREMMVSLVELERKPEMREMFSFIPQQLRQMIGGYLHQQMLAGALREMDAQFAAQAFLGMLLAYSFGLGLMPEGLAQKSLEQVVAQFVDIFLLGVVKENSYEE